MDETLYRNAAEFNPDRFMVEEPPMDPRLFTFGVGRRCADAPLLFIQPNYHVQQSNLLTTLESSEFAQECIMQRPFTQRL